MRSLNRVLTRAVACALGAALAGLGPRTLAATLPLPVGIDDGSTLSDPIKSDALVVSATGQLQYDDNLYRLPDGASPTTLVGPQATRADYIETAALELDGQGIFGRQSYIIDAQANQNWFSRNADLDYTGLNGAAVLNWSVGDRLAGEFGGFYTRTLADFASTYVYVKDLVDTSEGFATMRLEFLPHWMLIGGVRAGESLDSATVLSFDNVRRQSANGGIEYDFGGGSTVGVQYRYTQGRFEVPGEFNGVPVSPNYTQDDTRLVVKYVLSGKTTLELNGGYLERSYQDTGFGKFSGEVGRAVFKWEMTRQSKLVLAGWRDLNAYVEAEANYYVGNGASIAPVWSPTRKLSFSATASFENQHFLASGDNLVPTAAHTDIVRSAEGKITYQPTEPLSFDLSVRHLNRTSPIAQFQYSDNIALLSFTLRSYL
jgi:exopolysaccharide biosynthesis operon protein EpsL